MAKKKVIQKYDTIKDPFKEIALGLATQDKDNYEIWEEKPVGIVEFVESKKYLNEKWNGRTGCRPKILDILIEINKPEIREIMLLLGKGAGKDYAAAIFHLFGIHECICMVSPQLFYGLSRYSKIYFVNTARNDTQARKVFFEEFKGLLSGCAWFAGRHNEPGTISVEFQKRIEAMSVNSQAFGWLGFNTIRWVGDELAFFLANDKDEESESRAEECWEAAYGSCSTRFGDHYKIMGITTPRYDDDFVMKKFGELTERPDGYTKQAATWDVHPNRKKSDFKYALQRDYRRAMRDFGAIPSGVIESFWADPDFVENNVCEICKQCPIYQNRGISTDIFACMDYDDCKANAYMGNGKWRDWFRPVEGKDELCLHFDLSKNRDRVGFSVAHINDFIKIELDNFEIKERAEKEKIKVLDLDSDDRFQEKALIGVDAIGFIAPSSKRDHNLVKNGEIYYTGIFKFIIIGLIDLGFKIAIITFDQFQSHQMKQDLEDMGIDVELISLDRNDSLPVQAKIALTENRTEYPYSMILCDEARHLKFIAGKKSRSCQSEVKRCVGWICWYNY